MIKNQKTVNVVITSNYNPSSMTKNLYERKLIPDFPGYEIDDNGNVFSHWTNGGNIKNHTRTLKPFKSRNGYLLVVLSRDGKTQHKTIHRLLLETFTQKNPDLLVCHNNGIKTDNRIENLRWDTVKGNLKDREKHGTMVCGEKHDRAIFTEDQVRRIRLMWALNPRPKYKEVAKMFKTSISAISHIVNNRSWKHII